MVCNASVLGVIEHDSATLSQNVEIRQNLSRHVAEEGCWSSVVFASLMSGAALHGLTVHDTSSHLVCASPEPNFASLESQSVGFDTYWCIL